MNESSGWMVSASTVANSAIIWRAVRATDPRIAVLLEIIHFKVIGDQPKHRINSAEHYPRVGDELNARSLANSMKPHDIWLTQLSHVHWLHRESPQKGGSAAGEGSEA